MSHASRSSQDALILILGLNLRRLVLVKAFGEQAFGGSSWGVSSLFTVSEICAKNNNNLAVIKFV